MAEDKRRHNRHTRKKQSLRHGKTAVGCYEGIQEMTKRRQRFLRGKASPQNINETLPREKDRVLV